MQQPFIIYYFTCLCLFFSQYPLLAWSSFSTDDAHIIQLVLRYGWLAPYFEPEIYQQLSVVHYTPVVLSIYRAILEIFGLNTSAFIAVQLLAITTFSAFLGFFCFRSTQRLSAGFFAVALVFSSASLLPMLSHFYTIHYIFGGIFSLLALLLIQQKHQFSISGLIKLFIATVLALLCKEVYLMLIPLLWILLWRHQFSVPVVVVTLSLACYLGLRIYILGFSGEGRSGQGFFVDLFSIDIDTWINFAKWYFSTKWLIVLVAVVVMVFVPRKQSIYLLGASIFALPALAAPHSFRVPELHGDRIFFAFDCGLVIASTLAFYSESISKRFITIIILSVFLVIIPLQRSTIKTFSAHEIAQPAYQITQTLLYDLAKIPTTVFTPLSYPLGELMNIYRLLGNPWLHITQNCSYALTEKTEKRALAIFNNAGHQISLEALQQSCQLTDSPVVVKIPLEFHNGILQWDFTVPSGYHGGVFLIDRGFTVLASQFRERLVRPRPGEQYQFFMNKDNLWWFSDIQAINIY